MKIYCHDIFYELMSLRVGLKIKDGVMTAISHHQTLPIEKTETIKKIFQDDRKVHDILAWLYEDQEKRYGLLINLCAGINPLYAGHGE